ncbi:TetR/AcrR family transcriptional regulator [Spongiactinospora sp. 9N601]|uniref:TetR/AcrR family transcriptional regulator n=1 Tax=Spongiactinospora sp. 9N601 TaxID=3375149 RepID=UPI0037A018F1
MADKVRTGSRRDVILHRAARLFHEQGFHGTSIGMIGTAAGLKGPSVYRHFRDKNAVLVALIEESAGRAEADVAKVHQAGGTPAELLTLLIRLQTRQAVDDGPLTAVAAREVHSLPAETREPLLLRARRNNEEWTRLVADARPELTEDAARALVIAAKWLVFTVATSPSGLEADRLHRLITGMVLDLLLPDRPADL